jgi:hypothetical protein
LGRCGSQELRRWTSEETPGFVQGQSKGDDIKRGPKALSNRRENEEGQYVPWREGQCNPLLSLGGRKRQRVDAWLEHGIPRTTSKVCGYPVVVFTRRRTACRMPPEIYLNAMAESSVGCWEAFDQWLANLACFEQAPHRSSGPIRCQLVARGSCSDALCGFGR